MMDQFEAFGLSSIIFGIILLSFSLFIKDDALMKFGAIFCFAGMLVLAIKFSNRNIQEEKKE